jgi:hypothetical protein
MPPSRGASRFSPTRSGPCERRIARHDTREHVEEKFPLSRSEGIENAIISFDIRRSKLLVEPLSFARQLQQTSATVVRTHVAAQQAHLIKPFDQQARIIAIDAKACGQPTLIDARFSIFVVEI